MRPISLQEYDEEERRHTSALSRNLVRLFRQCVSSDRISNEQALTAYIDDVNGSSQTYFDTVLRGFSPNEFDRYQNVIGLQADFTEDVFGKVIIGSQTAMRCTYMLRNLEYLFLDFKPRILEICPGSSALGAMASKNGFSYTGIEFRQAPYLFQNRILKFALNHFGIDKGLTPSHLTWWDYAARWSTNADAYNVVILSSYCETLDPQLLKFIFLQAKEALRRRGSSGIVLLQEWNFNAAIKEIISSLGFTMFQKVPGIVMLVPGEELGSVKVQEWISILPRYEEVEASLRTIPFDQLITLSAVLLGTMDVASADEKLETYLSQPFQRG